MKRASLILAAALSCTMFLTITGFQCGSSEMTTAKLAYSQKNYDKADSSFLKEVELNPANAEAWYYLGRVRLEKGNYAGMAEAYKKSVSVSKEFEPKIQEEEKFAWGKLLNEGVNNYNRGAALAKDPAGAGKDSVNLYLQKAVDSYKTALLVNPDSSITYRNMAVAQHLLGNYDDEIATLEKTLAIRKDPEISTALINAYIQKAEGAKKAGNTAEATAGFDKAIKAIADERAANPGDQELLSTQINLYIDAGRAADALPLIKESVEKDPKNKTNQNNLGLLLYNQNILEEAISHFDAAVALDSNFEDALRNGAVACMKLGAKMKEDADAKAGSKGTPDKAYVGQFKHAVTLLEKLTSLKPDNADFHDALASAYVNAGMIKQGQAEVKKADELRKK